MARKLSQGQKAGLLFGGAILAGLLIVGRADRKLKGYINTLMPPKRKVPALGKKAPGAGPDVEPGGYAGRGAPIFARGCDPLRPETLAPYMLCVPDADGKLTIQPEYGGDVVPKIDNQQIGVAACFCDYKIGHSWVWAVLHPFLDEERKSGRFATFDHNAGSIADLLWNDPVSQINRWIGTDPDNFISVGDAVYSVAWLLTAPFWLPTAAEGIATRSVLYMGKTLFTLPAAIVGQNFHVVAIAASIAGTAAVASEVLGAGNEALESMYQDIHAEALQSETFTAWADPEVMNQVLEDLLSSAVEVFLKLIETRTCIWGYKERKEMYLAELPYGDNPPVHMMFQQIFKEILYFQRRDFSYEFPWNKKTF